MPVRKRRRCAGAKRALEPDSYPAVTAGSASRTGPLVSTDRVGPVSDRAWLSRLGCVCGTADRTPGRQVSTHAESARAGAPTPFVGGWGIRGPVALLRLWLLISARTGCRDENHTQNDPGPASSIQGHLSPTAQLDSAQNLSAS